MRYHGGHRLLLITVYLLACHTRTLMAAQVWWPTALFPAALGAANRLSRSVYWTTDVTAAAALGTARAWPWSRRPCCCASAEELADGQQQTGERQHDEDHLVDMVLARRQSAHQVYYPKGRIKPQRKPRPPFSPAIRDESDQHAEQAHANRRHAVSPHEQPITGHRHRRCDDTESQDGNTDDDQADPPDPQVDDLAPRARNLPPRTRQTHKSNGVNMSPED